MLIRTVKSNPQGWIVVGVCFLALSVISATRASLGLIMTELETDLGMFHAFGGAAGAFMGGYVYDLFNNYDWTWIVAIALAMAAGIMALTIRERRDDAELGEPVPAAG